MSAINWGNVFDVSYSRSARCFRLELEGGEFVYMDNFKNIVPPRESDYFSGPCTVGYYRNYTHKGISARVFENLGEFSWFQAAYRAAKKAKNSNPSRSISIFIGDNHFISL